MTTTTLPLRPPVRVRASFLRDAARSKAMLVIVFIAAHVLLAVLMRNFRIVGTAHAIGCVSVGLVYTAITKNIRNVALIFGYLVGCEVLWRMTKAVPFWEFGKYASIAILLVALARIKWRRNRLLGIAYFALLVPSIGMTLTTIPLSLARQDLSFNLSGPLLIAVAVLFFSNVRLTRDEIRDALLALIAPAVGIATLCYLTATRARLEFVNASNDYASGGFGANQVSAVLGLAVMFALFLTMERRLPWRLRIPLLILALALATQAVLTFSRGGVVLAFAGLCTAGFFMLRGNMRARISIIILSTVLSLFGKFVIEPRLDDLTGGQLNVRYTNIQSTGRDSFIDSELAMFEENPAFGVGPGVGYYYRIEHELKQGASHTEFSRMVGEHGLFGLLSIVCLIVLALRAVRGAREAQSRALAAAMVIWFALFLAVYGTRVAAPAFVFGIAFALRTVIPAKPRA
jgi:O-antigen ligase